VEGECGRAYRPRRPEATVLHRAVREGWPEVAAERGGLPKWLEEEVQRYLRCGVLRFGFVQVKCASCRESVLVGFSCKGRGWCPSCGARRAEETAAHCGEVLPWVGYRQWTLSVPYALRWAVVKRPKLLKRVERRLLQSVFRWQRQRAKQLGAQGGLRGGAVAFTQYFGSALQLTPHLHVLVPEGLWAKDDFVRLPPPEPEEVEGILRRAVKQLVKDFAELEEEWPEEGLEKLQSLAIQHRLALPEGEEPRLRKKSRLAVVEGFRLHADTSVQANDRQGLLRLCRYGSRGPIALERLSAREDGRYEYRTKRGPTLVLTATGLVKRLLALVPPRGKHLTCFHGVFAPNTHRRPPRRSPEENAPPPEAVKSLGRKPDAEGEATKLRRPRLNWAELQKRTFGEDVWRCHCGGRRRVLALVTHRQTAEEVLANMGLSERRSPSPIARDPPQLALAL
jgi:hypothetical protein